MSQNTVHLSLTTALAIGLGAAMTHGLWSTPAAGYPAGSTISSGINPVVAQGGRLLYTGGGALVFTAPSDQNIVVTDVVLTGGILNYDCRAQSNVTLSTDSTELGHYSVDMRTYSSSSSGVVTVHYESGLPVPAGESLRISTSGNFRSCSDGDFRVDYSISGYLAQP